MFNALIIGGGVAGMQCALVLGSGLKKPYAENKKVGVIMHQRSSHLQNALFNNVLGFSKDGLVDFINRDSVIWTNTTTAGIIAYMVLR